MLLNLHRMFCDRALNSATQRVGERLRRAAGRFVAFVSGVNQCEPCPEDSGDVFRRTWCSHQTRAAFGSIRREPADHCMAAGGDCTCSLVRVGVFVIFRGQEVRDRTISGCRPLVQIQYG